MQASKKHNKNRHLFKLLISMLILGGLLLHVDFVSLISIFKNIEITSWALVIGLFYLQLLSLSYRWQKLVNIHNTRISFGYAVKTNAIGLLANYLVVTSIGGIVVRITMTMQRGVSFVKSLSAAALDRGFTILALVILTLLCLPIIHDIVANDIIHNTLFMLLSALAVIGISCVIAFEELRKKIIFSHRKVSLCAQYLRSVFTRKMLLGQVVVSSMIAQILNFIAVYIIMTSMGIEFSMLHFLAIIPFITIISCLPIGYGGWGIREGAFVYGLGLIGVGFEAAFTASIQVGLISMAAALLFGIPAALRTDFKDFLSFKKKQHNAA